MISMLLYVIADPVHITIHTANDTDSWNRSASEAHPDTVDNAEPPTEEMVM